MKLTGQALADKYAKVYAYQVSKVSDVSVSDIKVWATYKGGGWIEICGVNLPCHKDLRDIYKNGWTLIDHKRSGYVRSYIHNMEVET